MPSPLQFASRVTVSPSFAAAIASARVLYSASPILATKLSVGVLIVIVLVVFHSTASVITTSLPFKSLTVEPSGRAEPLLYTTV